MKEIKLLFSLLLFVYIVDAQVIQTGKTDNAIIVKNTNAGFNIGESEVNLAFTNYFKPVIKPSGWIWGITGKAKNSDGLAAWFQNGDFQPSAAANGIFGWYITNVTDKLSFQIDEPTDKMEEYDSIKTNIDTHFVNLILDPSRALNRKQQKQLVLYVNSQLTNRISTFHALIEDLSDKTKTPSGEPEVDKLYKEMLDYLIKGEMDKRIKHFYSFQQSLNQFTNDISNLLSKRKFYSIKIFGTFGISAEKFTLFKGWDSSNLAKNFNKENFRGGNTGGGINFSWRGKWMFGVMDRYEESNNTDLLTSQKYSLTSAVTSGTQSAKTINDVTAYEAKDYSRVYFNSLFIDVLHYFPLVSDSAMIVSDLYFRHRSSNNNLVYESNSTIGVSGGLFKNSGKFMGGLYLELPDINEKLAKMDPTYISSKWYRRLSFGVYGKIAFSSLLHAL